MVQYLSSQPSPDTIDHFEIHLLVLNTAIINWRPYVVDLTLEANAHAAKVLGSTPDNTGPMSMSDTVQRQSLMILDEKALNALLAVRSTRNTISLFREFYQSAQISTSTQTLISDRLYALFMENIHELDVLINRLEALRTRLQGIANLVSSFLDLHSGFALQELTKESRKENEEMRRLSEKMHRLTERSTQDAATVKVLTILTLIYLPTTVVSNFFSTSFVGNSSNGNITVSSDWWIFAASSVPLTVLTLYIWWVWMRIQAHEIYPWWWIKRARPGRGHIVDPEKTMRSGLK